MLLGFLGFMHEHELNNKATNDGNIPSELHILLFIYLSIYLFIYLLQIHSTTLQANNEMK